MANAYQFGATEFKNLHESDVFILRDIVHEPQYSKTRTIIENGRRVHEAYIDLNEGAKKEAIRDLKTNLTPLFFVCAQKIYAEVFRFICWNNRPNSVGWKQVDIEVEMKSLLRLNFLTNFQPFDDEITFNEFWDIKYNFRNLRVTRNQLIHKHFRFELRNGSNFLVVEKNGSILLDWPQTKVDEFCKDVLTVSEKLIPQP